MATECGCKECASAPRQYQLAASLVRRYVPAMADTEAPDERPRCDYNTNPVPDTLPVPCGSEKGLNSVIGTGIWTGSFPPNIVCDEHRVKVWAQEGVERIEPLDRR
jgi:hypothetical protein